MIRLNLLAEHGVGEGKEAGVDVGGNAVAGALAGARAGLKLSATLSGNSSVILAKVGTAVAPLVAILLFEQIVLATKNSEKTTLQTHLNELQKEAVALKPKIDAAKRLQEEKGKLQVQIDTIKKLSRERLYNVKALNALQTLIPPKTWLTKLKFDEFKVDMEGKSADDSSVYEFVRALEGSIYFSAINVKKVEDSGDAEGANKMFSLNCKLESL